MQEIQSASPLLSIWGQEISRSQKNKIHTQANRETCTHIRMHTSLLKCPRIIGLFSKFAWDSWWVGRTSWPLAYRTCVYITLTWGKDQWPQKTMHGADIFHSLTKSGKQYLFASKELCSWGGSTVCFIRPQITMHSPHCISQVEFLRWSHIRINLCLLGLQHDSIIFYICGFPDFPLSCSFPCIVLIIFASAKV